MQSAIGVAAAPDLQELPFTPVHAPIMASAPGMPRYILLHRIFMCLLWHLPQECPGMFYCALVHTPIVASAPGMPRYVLFYNSPCAYYGICPRNAQVCSIVYQSMLLLWHLLLECPGMFFHSTCQFVGFRNCIYVSNILLRRHLCHLFVIF